MSPRVGKFAHRCKYNWHVTRRAVAVRCPQQAGLPHLEQCTILDALPIMQRTSMSMLEARALIARDYGFFILPFNDSDSEGHPNTR